MTIEIFKFGDPEPIHDDLSFLMESFLESSQDYYVPPIDLKGLAKIGRANATHQRCIVFKVNQMSIVYNQGLLSLRDHRRACQQHRGDDWEGARRHGWRLMPTRRLPLARSVVIETPHCPAPVIAPVERRPR